MWDRELAASDIAAQFDVTFGAVSQHLAVLREAGFVTVRKDGNRRLYQADKAGLGPLRHVLETMWAGTLDRLAAAVESDPPTDDPVTDHRSTGRLVIDGPHVDGEE